MDVLLASAPHADTFGYSMPPPGLLRLGGELRRRGIAVRLEDLAFRLASGALPTGDGLADAAAELCLARGAPGVLGLSTMGATLPIALAIAERVRRSAPRIPIVLGGPGTGGIDVQVLERFDCVDAVVRGEGEVTLPELLGRIAERRRPDGVAGLTWRDARGSIVREPDRAPLADLDTLAEYAWDLLPPLADYKAITGEAEGLAPIDSGRGCVYDCSFCSIGRYWSRRSRPLPARRLADEVAALRAIPGARNAYLCHDLFGADRSHAVAFCEELLARRVDVPWECRARADHLDGELLERMARAGCYRVLLGIESADPGVRRTNQKGMKDDVDLLAVVDACAAAGVVPILSLILGLPGEDEAALARSLDFCAAAARRAGVNLSLHLANPQPGCRLGDEHGEGARPVAGIPPDMAWGAGETAPERELIAAHPDLFGTWALLPWDEARLRDLRTIADELPEVLMRYPRTFALVSRLRVVGGERSASTLALYRAWQESGRSFESFALAIRDARVDDVLRWEQAIVRAAAHEPFAECTLADDGAMPVPAGELVTAHCDLAAFTRGDELPHATSEPQHFIVQPTRGALAGVRTLRVSNDVTRLLSRLDGRTRVAELDTARPGMRAALETLAREGVVTTAPSP